MNTTLDTTTTTTTTDTHSLSCINCDETIEKEWEDYHITNNGVWCEECFDDNHFPCDNCNEYQYLTDLVETFSVQGTRALCELCLSAYTQCDDCNNYVENEEICYVHGLRRVCQSCLDDYFVCEDCNHYNHISGAIVVEYDTQVCRGCLESYQYCEHCDCWRHIDNLCTCTGAEIENLYHYDYVPDSFKYNCTTAEDRSKSKPLYLGFELEIEAVNGAEREDIVDITFQLLNSWTYCKEDGSLDDGVEIVSHPSTLGWLKLQAFNIEETLKDISNIGARSYDTETCGMHVHLSRNCFTSLHLYKFMRMVYEEQDFTLRISQREEQELEQWASPHKESDKDLQAKALAEHGNGLVGRYVAVNLQNKETVELRIFRGTLKPQSFWKNLEYCDALFRFTKQASLADCTEEAFTAWLERNKPNYPNLLAFLATEAINTNKTTPNQTVTTLMDYRTGRQRELPNEDDILWTVFSSSTA